MDESAITDYITSTFPDVATTAAMGYTFFFVGEDRMMPFATLAADDNEHDAVSNLARPSVYRLNVGVSRETYRALFGPQPKAAGPQGDDYVAYDFTALDQVMPHPTYAPQSWVCVLSPGDRTLDQVRSLLAEAYELAAKRKSRRSEAPPGDS